MQQDDLMSDRRINNWPYWPDAKGWVGIGIFGLTVMLLWMMRERALREDEFFQTIATVIISNGLMAVVAWAFGATITGARMAEENAKALTKQPLQTEIINTKAEPVPVAPASDDGELPEDQKL